MIYLPHRRKAFRGDIPLSLSPAFWFDFSDASTIYTDDAKTTLVTTDGDVVGTIADKSGNGFDLTQSVLSKKPIYKTSIVNGLSIGRFNSSILINTALTAPNIITYFIVYSPAFVNLAPNIIIDGGLSHRHTVYSADDTNYGILASKQAQPGVVVTIDTPVIITVGFNSTASTFRVNDGTATTGLDPGSVTQVEELYIGGAHTSSYYISMDMCEAFAIPGVVSSSNLTKIIKYLNTKWSIY